MSLRLLAACAAAGLLALTGCQSVQEHRAAQQGSYFVSLSPVERERLLEGQVRPGDSPEAVYIALGTPQYTTTAGDRWIWAYWGTRREAAPPPADRSEDLPAFLTRAEFRLPRPGEVREELRLVFAGNRLESWSLGAIDMEAAREREFLPLGTLPRRDRRPDAS